jgi:uncharacterized membrane protein YfcA
MTIAGYLAVVLVGISLGLIGGGGSILTLPILVYLFGVSPTVGTGYSLFIVGVAAAFGAFQYARQKLVNYKIGLIFALPAFLGVFLARKFIVPSLPDTIFEGQSFAFSKDTLIMMAFGVMMLAAAFSMIKGRKDTGLDDTQVQTPPLLLTVAEGLIVGAITGFVGAGGGFLIIPALVVLAKLPMKMAVGTSLMIIAIKSIFGFAGDITSGPPIEWAFLGLLTATALVGILVGSSLVKKIPGDKLKPAFGWFVLVMGGFVITMQLIR